MLSSNDKTHNYRLIENGFWEGFTKVAGILGIVFDQKLDDWDSQFWVFEFDPIEFSPHYHQMPGDIDLFTDKTESYTHPFRSH